MKLRFRNSNTNYKLHEVFVTFCGAGTLVGKYGSSPLVPGQSYSLEQLIEGVSLTTSRDGRICISLGKALTTATASNGYSPNFANPSLADYGTRWDKAEITYVDGSGGINLSAQDFFSVPLRITTDGQKSLTWTQSTPKVMNALGALSSFAILSLEDKPQGALAVGASGVVVPGVVKPVVRILSPATVTPFADGSTVYPVLAGYLSFVEKSSATTVWGNNGAGQWYKFSATVSAGQLKLGGAVDGGSGQVATTAQVSSLTDTMIYGANPPFVITRGTDLHGMVTRAMADYFAGLNFGLVGSPEKIPGHTAHTVGGLATWHWYGNNPNGVDQPALPIADAFAAAQRGQPSYYNSYASYLTTVGDAYGFAYNDRLQSPLTSIGAGQTVTIEVLPDTQA